MVIREEIYQEIEETLELGGHQPYRRSKVSDGHLAGAALPDGWSPVDFFANDSSVLLKPKRDANGKVVYE